MSAVGCTAGEGRPARVSPAAKTPLRALDLAFLTFELNEAQFATFPPRFHLVSVSNFCVLQLNALLSSPTQASKRLGSLPSISLRGSIFCSISAARLFSVPSTARDKCRVLGESCAPASRFRNSITE